MFNFQDFGKLMKEAKNLSQKNKEIQEKLKTIEVEGFAGGDYVKVVATATGVIKSITISDEEVEKIHSEILAIKSDADYLQRIEYIELRQRLPELLLMRVDKIGMAHSLEARVPFLDHRLVEFTMSIPPRMKAPDKKSTKTILKKAVESILPNDIIYRKKQGFWAPVNEWLRNEWYDYAYSTIMNSYFVKEKIFNEDYISHLFKIHKTGKRNQGLQLFSLLTLSLWYNRHFR